MKILILLLIAVNAYCQFSVKGNSFSNNKTVISYTNTSIHYHGRWNDNGTGMTSGWAGSFMRIRYKNTSNIQLNLYSENNNVATQPEVTYTYDNGYDYTTNIVICPSGALFTGNKNINVPTINDGNFHEILIYLAGGFPYQQQKVCVNVLKSITIDYGGIIIAPTRGTKKIQCIGDSWTFNKSGWQKYLGLNTYDIYQISNGGIMCTDVDPYYNYDYSGILNTTDPTANAVIISFGVNEFLNTVSVSTFQTSLLSLIDKIQAKQSGVKIFLVRVPSNGANNYGQYGTAMSNAVGLRSNVIYVNTSSLDATMVFSPDIYHLDQNSRITLADFVKTQLTANGI